MGHIEDIAVDTKEQGRKVGLRIIQALVGISEGMGCYKTILNCSDKNIRESLFRIRFRFRFLGRGADDLLAFYEKCGFQKKENEMVRPPLFSSQYLNNSHSSRLVTHPRNPVSNLPSSHLSYLRDERARFDSTASSSHLS